VTSPLRGVRTCLIAVPLTVGLVLGLGACSNNDQPTASSAPPSPSASPTPPPPPPTTLLSGRKGKDHQVLVVKVDNTVNSTPHAGLLAADVVYLEQVEYGLTRYMAVYSSHYPKKIEPIRSARISDMQIIRQYGKVAFAFSGSNPRIVNIINHSFLYPMSNDAGDPGFARDPNRPAPWNLIGYPKQLLKNAPKAIKAKDVGFTFSDDAPAGGIPAKQVTVNWPGATANWRWSKSADTWELWMDGNPATTVEGPQLHSSTVIVQSCEVHNSKYGDAYGGITPITKTVGHGTALLMRNGRVYHIQWSRPHAKDGTTWTFHGQPIPMDPGSVWIMLLDKTRHPTVKRVSG
jgi:hypothetical protein